MKTIKFIVVALILMTVQIASASAQSPVVSQEDAEFYLNSGNGYIRQGKYSEAVTAYSECVRLKPDQVACYLNRGSAYVRLENFQEAINNYSKVIRIEPKDTTAYIFRGTAFREMQKYEDAISDFKTVLKLDPNKAFLVQTKLAEAEKQAAQNRSAASRNMNNQPQKTEKDWEKVVRIYNRKMTKAQTDDDFDLEKKVYQDFLQETKDAGDSRTIRIERDVLLRELYRTEDKELQKFVESEMKRLDFNESNKTFTRTGQWN